MRIVCILMKSVISMIFFFHSVSMCTLLSSSLRISSGSRLSGQRWVINRNFYMSIIYMSCINPPFQVMSVGIDSEGIDLFPSSDQLIYRIYTDHSLGLLPNENEYVTILSPSPLFSLCWLLI